LKVEEGGDESRALLSAVGDTTKTCTLCKTESKSGRHKRVKKKERGKRGKVKKCLYFAFLSGNRRIKADFIRARGWKGYLSKGTEREEERGGRRPKRRKRLVFPDSSKTQRKTAAEFFSGS